MDTKIVLPKSYCEDEVLLYIASRYRTTPLAVITQLGMRVFCLNPTYPEAPSSSTSPTMRLLFAEGLVLHRRKSK